MRHLAHCLILMLAPVAAQASDALNGAGRGGCSYAPSEVERVAVPAAAASIATTAPATAAPPAKTKATQSVGGSSDDDILPRLRAPRWHRMLPGMFR